MNNKLSEKKVLSKLDIQDFEHMPKDKVTEFTSLLPVMDPDVAKKALEQFPEFKDMTIEVVKQLCQTIDNMIGSNDRSQDVFYSTCQIELSILNDELQKDTYTLEDRNNIRKSILHILEMISAKDTENKKYLMNMVSKLGVGALGCLAIASVIIGGDGKLPIKFMPKSRK